MGIGRSPDCTPLLEHPDVLVMAWGATVPMIAHAAGIMLDQITTTWDKWVAPTERKTAKGLVAPGNVAAAAGCLATGLRALNAVPAINALSPGWVTALDLPLIPGAGTIR